MKKILIATDFSEDAWNAAHYAIEMHKDEDCVFYLLNTYTPTKVSGSFMAEALAGHSLESVIKSNSENGLKKVVGRIQKTLNYPNHSFKTISSFNLLVDEIKKIVNRENIDLIVTGAKGASGLEGVFLGSNTVHIIKCIKNCPVLAIPSHFRFTELSEIAFATDFNRFYTITELQPLLELVKTFKASIHIVHVQYKITELTEIQQFNMNMLCKYMEGIDHNIHTVTELRSVSNTLEAFAEELNIHLLAMLNYRHSLMDNLTKEPIVDRLVFHSNVPLLVLPELGMGASSASKKHSVIHFTD
ncbi:universal stress protein [Sediminicola sp. 1XM1-17]|uniref:universal stress protein n=1 Tax=Sediminicola sp. 1XM1-17 TaxID=3127702 RepID=UPI0030774037